MKISDVIKKGAKYDIGDLSMLEIVVELFEHASLHTGTRELQIAFNTLPSKVRKAAIKDLYENHKK